MRGNQERIKGTEKASPYTPYSIGNSSRVIDDPRSEPRVLHELTLKKMAEDADSDIAIRFVDEND